MRGIYIDDEGRQITTHSMLKSFSRCPNQARYKYAERLKKRFITTNDKPLKRGTWFHELLEWKYAGKDWREKHKQLTRQFNGLFDEEKDALGDLPKEMVRLMKSYEWHYGADKSDPYHGWEVIGTEMTFECPWPDSKGKKIYRCRIDMLIRDEFGDYWIVDHKTHKTLPNATFRILDAASPLYIWCVRENGYDVTGFIWNYIKVKAPTIPKLAYEGTTRERLSLQKIETDYPTFKRALKAYEMDETPYRDQLKLLYSQRFKRDAVQSSPFFRRDTLEKDDAMIARVLAASMKTRDRMHGYDYDSTDSVERTVDMSCNFRCSYTDLCTVELLGGDATRIRRQQFRVGDPLDYYQDQKEVEEE